jgi:hypothetical protein
VVEVASDESGVVGTLEILRKIPEDSTRKCFGELIVSGQTRGIVVAALSMWAIPGEEGDYSALANVILRESNRVRKLVDIDSLSNTYIARSKAVLAGRRFAEDQGDMTARQLLSATDDWIGRIPNPLAFTRRRIQEVDELDGVPPGLDLVDQAMAWSKILYSTRPDNVLPGRVAATAVLAWIGTYWGGGSAGLQFGGKQHLKMLPDSAADFSFCSRGEAVKKTTPSRSEGRCVFVKGDPRGIIVNGALPL